MNQPHDLIFGIVFRVLHECPFEKRYPYSTPLRILLPFDINSLKVDSHVVQSVAKL